MQVQGQAASEERAFGMFQRRDDRSFRRAGDFSPPTFFMTPVERQ